MDFLKETNGSKLYNFHSHTEFCDGRATMEAFAREAVRCGFTHYGFSPHSPIPIESPCNMHADKVSRYLAEVERIKAAYADWVKFYASMEVDYLRGEFGPSHSFIQKLPLDYVIGSVHFVPTRDGRFVDCDGRYETFRRRLNDYFHDDIRYVVETFFASTIEMIEAGGFDIIGHFDKIGLNASYYKPGIEQEPWYRALAADVIDAIAAHNAAYPGRPITVEINTKAYADHNGRIFPSPELWGQLRRAGIPLIVNSDAHVPALINASRFIATEMLELERAGAPEPVGTAEPVGNLTGE